MLAFAQREIKYGLLDFMQARHEHELARIADPAMARAEDLAKVEADRKEVVALRKKDPDMQRVAAAQDIGKVAHVADLAKPDVGEFPGPRETCSCGNTAPLVALPSGGKRCGACGKQYEPAHSTSIPVSRGDLLK
jgi:hypothetical protein